MTNTTRWQTSGLLLATGLASLGASLANVALPSLQGAFGASLAEVQGVVVAYLLATTLLVVVAGRLGDALGRRRLLLAGLALFAVASVACGLAPSLPLLVAARAAQGAGAAVMVALAPALAGDAAPRGRAGSALGLLGTASAVGTALGPTLGGLLLGALGWRAPFLVLAALALAGLAVAGRHLPAERPAAGRTAGAPLLALLCEPALRAGLLTSALVAAVVMATTLVGPFHLSRGLGLSPAVVGLLLSVGPAVVALAGAPAGRLVDRVGARRAGLAGLVGMVVGALGLSLLPGRLGVAGYLAPLVVLTAGYALFQTANTTAVLAGLPADRRGVVSGLLALSRNLGLLVGASALGALFAWAAGTGAAPADVVAGTQTTFGAATLLLLAALAIAGPLRPRGCACRPRRCDPDRVRVDRGRRADRVRSPSGASRGFMPTAGLASA